MKRVIAVVLGVVLWAQPSVAQLARGSSALPAQTRSAALPAQAKTVADRFFTDKRLAETRALLVLVDGQVVYERYGPGFSASTRLIGWSMSKSVTATLVGDLVDKGRLLLDAPAPVKEWRGDKRGAITTRQLLHMSSGLAHQEATDRPEDDHTVRILFTDRAADAAGYSAAMPLESAPGTVFEYSTATTKILSRIVGDAVAPGVTVPDARRAKMWAYLRDRLGPMMPSLVCEFDAAGTMLGGSLCHATARDWAAFGQMYLEGGVAGGRQVVSPAWVRFVQTPAPTNAQYGGHFWLNRGKPSETEVALFPSQGPADAYAAVGHLGQYVIIVPSKKLVLVRLGNTLDPALGSVRVALGRLVNAVPNG